MINQEDSNCIDNVKKKVHILLFFGLLITAIDKLPPAKVKLLFEP